MESFSFSNELGLPITWPVAAAVTLVQHLKNDFTVINVDILGYGSVGDKETLSSLENYRASIEVERIQQALQHLHVEVGF